MAYLAKTRQGLILSGDINRRRQDGAYLGKDPIMARSTSKVILFSRVTVNKQVHQWPTAVFNNHEDARSFATILGMAHKSGDAATATAMDAKTAKAEDGTLIAGLKFSIVEVPYSPPVSIGASDMLDDDTAPTT
jgi:hypothetical protein